MTDTALIQIILVPILILITGASVAFYVRTMDRRIDESKADFNLRYRELKKEMGDRLDKIEQELKDTSRKFIEFQRDVDKQMGQLERYGLKMLHEYGDVTKRAVEAIKSDIERLRYVVKGLPKGSGPVGS